MESNILDYLICPACNNYPLEKIAKTKEDSKKNGCENGSIVCSKCKKNYPIIGDAPVLLDEFNTSDIIKNMFEPSSEHLEYELKPTKKIARLLKRHNVDTVLDVACGSGAYTSYFNCKTLISFDFSPYFINKCIREQAGNQFRHFMVADLMNMPFKENSFDLIFASSILEHLKPNEMFQTITKFNKILKNDGIIQIDLPNSSSVIEFTRKIMTYMKIYKNTEFDENPELGHHSFFVKKDLKELGFEVRGCIGWVTRKSLPLGVFWELYDFISWYFPSLAGTLIGTKKVSKV